MEMTFTEAKEVFINRGWIEVKGGRVFDGKEWRQSCVVISEWLKQESCEDTISRQAVKEQMIKYGFHASDMTVTEFVEDLPPVASSCRSQQNDVLDKIRTEIIQAIQNGTLKIESGNEKLFRIIDKYKTESEGEE